MSIGEKTFFLRNINIQDKFPLLLLFLPFYLQGPIDFSDGIYVSIIYTIVLICLLYLFHRFIKGNGSLYYTSIDLSVIMFVLYFICLGYFINSDFYINDRTLFLLILSITYLLFRFFAQSNQYINLIFFILFFLGLAAELIAFWQLFPFKFLTRRQSGLTSIFSNTNIFTSYLTIILPIAINLLDYHTRSKKNRHILRMLAIIFIVFAFYFFVITLSRAAIITSIILILFVLFDRYKNYVKKNKILSLLLIFSCLFSVLFFASRVKQDSTAGRMLILRISNTMFIEHPIFGIGYNNFPSYYNNSQALYFLQSSRSDKEKALAGEVYNPLNEYLRVGVEGGLIGLLLFISIIVQIALVKRSDINSEKSTLYYCLIIYIILSFISYPLVDVYLGILFFALLGLFSTTFKSKSLFNIKTSISFTIFPIMLTCCILLLGSRVLFITKWKISSNANMMDKESILEYNKVLPWLRHNEEFLVELGDRYLNSGNLNEALALYESATKELPSISLYLKTAEIHQALHNQKLAEKNYIIACNIAPSLFKPKYHLFKFYQEIGKSDKCLELGREILSMPIKIPSFTIDVIKDDVKKGIDKL